MNQKLAHTSDPDELLKEVLDLLLTEEDRRRNDSVTRLTIKQAIWLVKQIRDIQSKENSAR